MAAGERDEQDDRQRPPTSDGGAVAAQPSTASLDPEKPAAAAAAPEPEPAATAEEPTFLGLDLPRPSSQPIPGAPAGIEPHELTKLPSTGEPVVITCIDYAPDHFLRQDVDDIEDFILHHRPEWSAVRWINVDGLGNMDVIRALADKYELHPLAIEDLLHRPQRPKVDPYPAGDGRRARLFIIVRMLELEENHLRDEQISIFVGHKTILTFQERAGGDVWGAIRARLKNKGSRLRTNDASFLAYALLDAIVDHCFPILEFYGDRLEELEDTVLEHPTSQIMHDIHALKRELLLLRRAIWPVREVIHTLQREPHECFSDVTRTYLRDVYDHVVQIIDIVETYREFANSMTETYMSAVSLRMNEVIKVLTVFATIFTPATFLASVYGMNFEYLPELQRWWAYPAFWAICITSWIAMVVWFRRRGWM